MLKVGKAHTLVLKTGKAPSCALTLKVGKAQSHLSAKNRQSIESCSDAQKLAKLGSLQKRAHMETAS